MHSFSDVCMIRYTNSNIFIIIIQFVTIINYSGKQNKLTINDSKIVCYSYRRLEG